jgi:hypothetical protein
MAARALEIYSEFLFLMKESDKIRIFLDKKEYNRETF